MKNFLKAVVLIVLVIYSAESLFSENVYERFPFLIIPALLVWYFYKQKNVQGFVYRSGFEGLKNMSVGGRIGSIFGLIISLISLFLAGLLGFYIFMFIGLAGPAGAAEMATSVGVYLLLAILSCIVAWLMIRIIAGKERQ